MAETPFSPPIEAILFDMDGTLVETDKPLGRQDVRASCPCTTRFSAL